MLAEQRQVGLGCVELGRDIVQSTAGRSAASTARAPPRSAAGLSGSGDRAELHQGVQQRRPRSRRGCIVIAAIRAAPHSVAASRRATETPPPRAPRRSTLRGPVDQRGPVGAGLGPLCEPVVEHHSGSPKGVGPGYRCRSCRFATRTPRPRRTLYAPIEWQRRRATTRTSSTSAPRAIAKITINRPEVHNAFRPPTLAELRDAFTRARDDIEVARDHLHRRGRRGLLLGRRPAHSRRRRLHRRRRGRPAGRRPARRGRPPRPDPAPAEARGRDGRRLRRRRRAHPAPGLRHDDRRRERRVRPNRPAGRQLRRRLRREPARPQRRRQEGQGVLVPLPPLRRGGGAGDGARQRRRSARRARARDGRLVPRDGAPSPPWPCACSRRASTPTRTGSPGSSSSPTTRRCSST